MVGDEQPPSEKSYAFWLVQSRGSCCNDSLKVQQPLDSALKLKASLLLHRELLLLRLLLCLFVFCTKETAPRNMASGNASSLQDAQNRRCKFLSYMFYQSVRDHKPVWLLEDMRTMEYFYWEESANMRTYSPSEALLYAVVHNHLPYAQYLLSHFPEEALKVPGEHFCYCPSSAPHLAMAVTYDRRDILGLIISIAHKLPSLNSYINRTGCFHLEDGKTPLHLACELLRSETVLILLGNGASPRIEDNKGLTPLDVILEQMWDSKVNVASKKLCLDYLLLFMPSPRFKLQKVLREHPEPWAVLLGEDRFNSLVGNTPATLYLQAMQTILQILPPSHFPKSIQELPIPQALKPLPCMGKQHLAKNGVNNFP